VNSILVSVLRKPAGKEKGYGKSRPFCRNGAFKRGGRIKKKVGVVDKPGNEPKNHHIYHV